MKNNKIITIAIFVVTFISLSCCFISLAPLMGNVRTILLIIILIGSAVISLYLTDNKMNSQVSNLEHIFRQFGFVPTEYKPHRFSKPYKDPRLNYCWTRKVDKYSVFAWPVSVSKGESFRIVPYIFIEKALSVSDVTITSRNYHSDLFVSKLIDKLKTIKFEVDIPQRKIVSSKNDVNLWKLFDPVLLNKLIDASEYIYIYINKTGVGFLVLEDYKENTKVVLDLIKSISRN